MTIAMQSASDHSMTQGEEPPVDSVSRSEFEAWASSQGLPLQRLDNDSRYESMETEWAYRGSLQTFNQDVTPVCTEQAAGKEIDAVEAAFAAFDNHDAPVDKGYLGDACRAYHRVMASKSAPDGHPPAQYVTDALAAMDDALKHVSNFGLDLIYGGSAAWVKLKLARDLLEKAGSSAQKPSLVPDGFDLSRTSNGDIVVIRASDKGFALFKRNSSFVTETMSWLLLDAMLRGDEQQATHSE